VSGHQSWLRLLVQARSRQSTRLRTHARPGCAPRAAPPGRATGCSLTTSAHPSPRTSAPSACCLCSLATPWRCMHVRAAFAGSVLKHVLTWRSSCSWCQQVWWLQVLHAHRGALRPGAAGAGDGPLPVRRPRIQVRSTERRACYRCHACCCRPSMYVLSEWLHSSCQQALPVHSCV
jgi:hypothetical protein